MIACLMVTRAVKRVAGKGTFALAGDHKNTAQTLKARPAQKPVKDGMGFILTHPMQIETGFGVNLAPRKLLTGAAIKPRQRWWRGRQRGRATL